MLIKSKVMHISCNNINAAYDMNGIKLQKVIKE